MTRRLSIKNKERKAKRKNSVRKKRLNRDKKTKQRNGSRTRYICTFKQLLDHCTTVRHKIWTINFVISKQFFSAIDAV